MSEKKSAGDDSLDFTHLGDEAQSPPAERGRDKVGVERPRAATARKPKPKPAVKQEKTRRSAAVPLVIVTAIAIAVAVAVTDRTAQEVATPKAKPAPFQTPRQPAQAYAPPSKPPVSQPVPPTKPAAPTQPPALPPEFLKELQDYKTRTGVKALALALDPDGRYAFATVAGVEKQATANEEALSDCARYRAQSGIKTSCRLYAVADKVVW